MIKIINFFLTLRTFLSSAIEILDYVIDKILLFNCHGENYTLAKSYLVFRKSEGG